MARIGSFSKRYDRNVSEVGERGDVAQWRNGDGVTVTVTKRCDFHETVPDNNGGFERVHNLEYMITADDADGRGGTAGEAGLDRLVGSKSRAMSVAADLMRLIANGEIEPADLEI